MIITHYKRLSTAELAYKLGLRKRGSHYYGQCRGCGYKNAFTLTEKNGYPLWYCHAGCDSNQVTSIINDIRFSGSPPAKVANPAKANHSLKLVAKPSAKLCESSKQQWIKDLWQRSQPAKSTVVERYLNGRSITIPIPESIRFLPNHRDTDSGHYYPVMLSAVYRVGVKEPIALHRTYLKPDGTGKADIERPKKFLGQTSGGAVPLAKPSDKLYVAEGLETALSVWQATKQPTWAALSTGGLKSLILPESVKNIVICADNDKPGLNAANEAAQRWSCHGLTVRVIHPPKARTDFNDYIRGETSA